MVGGLATLQIRTGPGGTGVALNDTTKAAGEGTGLGLSISYDIIATKHRGKLLVDSFVGEGTTFRIELPIEPSKISDHSEVAKDGNKISLVRG